MLFIVLLAMVAGFLALRLYSVLGKRTGHEQPLPKPAEERGPMPVSQRPVEKPGDFREPAVRTVEPGAEAGVRAIIDADPRFDVTQFLSGARSAYEMILDAFWKGDRDSLAWLVEDDVREGFEAAIEERNAAGQVLDNRVVAIERAVITAARLESGVAEVIVRFDADIAAVTRDRDGAVIAGSLSDAVQTHDIWTFSRRLRSDDPNWKLSETDEA
ncbi:Tim44/TimA family putative adaptor protein [Sphingomonas sp. CJ99]